MAITPLPAAPSRSAPSTFSTLADAWVAALAAFVTEANALAAAMNLNDTTATSTTSLTIGTGAQSLTVDASKSYQVGMSVQIAHDSTNWMHGEVTSYNAGTGALVVNVTSALGSGTETAWTVTLSAPISTTFTVQVALNGSSPLTTSDKAYFRIPGTLNGMNLVAVAAMCVGASSSGTPTFTVKNGATSMLSTNLTIDAGETDSSTAAVPAVINAANDGVATGNQIEVACSGSGTGVTYTVVELQFQNP